MEKREGEAYQTLPGCAARGAAQQQCNNPTFVLWFKILKCKI
jgi:hypothetical protein